MLTAIEERLRNSLTNSKDLPRDDDTLAVFIIENLSYDEVQFLDLWGQKTGEETRKNWLFQILLKSGRYQKHPVEDLILHSVD